jgi:hypothetical protein
MRRRKRRRRRRTTRIWMRETVMILNSDSN